MNAIENGQDAGHADLLVAIRDLYETVDPMPPGLPGRIRLSLRSAAGLAPDPASAADLDAEIARLVSDAGELALTARGRQESRTVTFDSDSLTIMVRVEANPDGTARVDGWLAPPEPRPVEARLAGGSITVTADEGGRFVFESLPRGPARLVVRPPRAGTPGGLPGEVNSVITPEMALLAGE